MSLKIRVLALLLGNLWECRGCNASEVVDPRLNHFKQPKSMHPGVAETQRLQDSLKFTNVENTGWGRIEIEQVLEEELQIPGFARRRNISHTLPWKRRHFSPKYGNHHITINLWLIISSSECMFRNPCGLWTTEIVILLHMQPRRYLSSTLFLSTTDEYLLRSPATLKTVLGLHIDWNSHHKGWRLACVNFLWVQQRCYDNTVYARYQLFGSFQVSWGKTSTNQKALQKSFLFLEKQPGL